MFRIVLISAVLLLLLFVGPIRRWFSQRAWRFILPGLVGFAVGVPIAQKLIAGSGAPREVGVVLPLFAGLIIAGTLKTVLDEVLGPPKNPQ